MNSVTMSARLTTKQVAERERAPPPAEALDDQPRVARSGHRAQSGDHLLLDEQDRGEQRQYPQAAWFRNSCPAWAKDDSSPGVVVGRHHDEPRAGSRAASRAGEQRPPRRGVEREDRSQSALDVADVGAVQHRPAIAGRRERRPHDRGRGCAASAGIAQSPLAARRCRRQDEPRGRRLGRAATPRARRGACTAARARGARPRPDHTRVTRAAGGTPPTAPSRPRPSSHQRRAAARAAG